MYGNQAGLALRPSQQGASQRESKWGQIKIQDDLLFAARNALTKFCSDPFCAVCGAQDPRHARPHPHSPASPAQPGLTRTALAARACEWAAWKTTYSLNSSTPSKQASGVHRVTSIFCCAVRFGAVAKPLATLKSAENREFAAWSAANLDTYPPVAR